MKKLILHFTRPDGGDHPIIAEDITDWMVSTTSKGMMEISLINGKTINVRETQAEVLAMMEKAQANKPS